MRTVFLCAAIGAMSLLSAPAAAQGAWCSEDMNSRNCGWYTLAQCQAGASGNGGGCYANPYAAKAPAAVPNRGKRVRQNR
jgi:hypothetical protein